MRVVQPFAFFDQAPSCCQCATFRIGLADLGWQVRAGRFGLAKPRQERNPPVHGKDPNGKGNQVSETSNTAYRVLARKYRPASFSAMVGQEALVRTLSNALSMGRLAHAFVLTGVRGVGKTSTARILARGLNCVGPDGTGEPTLEPCGQCEPCRQIAEGRHVDVLEMDAASHTGVDDVREIIDGTAYRPVSARHKIYIIDEVHMLSRSAFNALLKTLEEPPEAVIFIFATTEIRKVPVTILSRCQRFDLRRVPTDLLADHLSQIAAAETITISAAAVRLLARAAEGSVRDALSLLDQAAAMGEDTIDEALVAAMLGQADASALSAILAAALGGDTEAALAGFNEALSGGAEPERVIADLLDLVHLASLQAAGAPAADLPEAVRQPVASLAEQGIARLGRSWQILLAGHGEMARAPHSGAAAEMLLIRLAHTAPMPTPAEILARLPDAPSASGPAAGTPAAGSPAAGQPVAASSPGQAKPNAPADAPQTGETSAAHPPAPMASAPAGPASIAPQLVEPQLVEPQLVEPQLQPEPPAAPLPDAASPAARQPSSLAEMADLLEAAGERALATRLRLHVGLVSLAAGRLEIKLVGDAPNELPGQLAKALSEQTGQRWMVLLSEAAAEPTLHETSQNQLSAERLAAADHPVVAEILARFPGAEVSAVIPHEPADLPETDRQEADENSEN